jgi:hypothetical protein
MMDATERIAVYGTEEPPPAIRHLDAGPLEVELQDGQVRAVRWHGIEVLRGIAFLVRDAEWGTLPIHVVHQTVDRRSDGFVVNILARAQHAGARLDCTARIAGSARGSLAFEATGRVSGAALPTNRTGFVVLHPIAGVAGRPLDITHGDGSTTSTRFPDAIAPFQPASDIRGLQWSPAPGVTARCLMEGDLFEMEDQRNWGDASFKTYVRPLARGFPYVIRVDEPIVQTIRLTVAGRPEASHAPAAPRRGTARMPRIGLAMDADDAAATQAAADQLRGLGAAYLTARFDPARGHGVRHAAAIAAAACALGAQPEAELVVRGRDPQRELAAIAEIFRDGGLEPSLIAPFPLRDFRTRPPGVPDGEAGIAAILAAARHVFPGVRLLAGSPVLFTELNRNPPIGEFDVIGHAFSATIHAADDRSVLETLETITAMGTAAAAMAPGRQRRIGLAAIGLRDNPYGAVAANPARVRRTVSDDDPRHGARFGAAFGVALAAAAAQAGIESLTLAMTTGRLGVERGGQPTPLAAAIALLSRRAGQDVEIIGGAGCGFVALLVERLPALVASLSPAVMEIDEPEAGALPPFAVREA